jgi:hypothetical protein
MVLKMPALRRECSPFQGFLWSLKYARVSKETYYMAKETYSYGKRDLFIWQKRSINSRIREHTLPYLRALVCAGRSVTAPLACRGRFFFEILRAACGD